MTTDETKEILRLICAAYPTQRQRMTGTDLHAMLEVWSLALADITLEQARGAAARIVCSSKWLPSIAEFRLEIGELHHGRKRNGLDAWGDVKKLFTYRVTIEDVDPLVLYVCTRFDWIKTRELVRGGEEILQWHVVPGDNEESDRIRFAQLYDSLAADDRKAAQLTAGGAIPQRQIGARGVASIGELVQGMLPSGNS